jgi:hypothetical protein
MLDNALVMPSQQRVPEVSAPWLHHRFEFLDLDVPNMFPNMFSIASHKV